MFLASMGFSPFINIGIVLTSSERPRLELERLVLSQRSKQEKIGGYSKAHLQKLTGLSFLAPVINSTTIYG